MKTESGAVKENNAKGKKKIKKAKTKKKQQKFLKIRCPICFNNLTNEAVSSTRCGHVFCTQCLMKAMSLKRMCPLCRVSLRSAMGCHPLYLHDNICEEDTESS
ncbi:hypothetical protein ABMA27_009378 [Loxostege sticticalis]|uniref:RING-type domain-containing protein n=1 Tax=Loxostege sticticalis TaxID=481309 RepID=A0ABR3H7Z5_LOXSC